MSILDGDATPSTTGSITQPISVQQPLPSTLAYSDATKIGEAATAVLAQAEGGSSQEWINVSTGSSGTLQREESIAKSENCREFSTIVTSVGGVHRYSGAICRQTSGPAIVQIDERTKDDRT
jgi:surface antigen